MTELELNADLLTLLPSEVCSYHLVPAYKSLIQEFCSRSLNHRQLEIIPGRSIYAMEISSYYKSKQVSLPYDDDTVTGVFFFLIHQYSPFPLTALTMWQHDMGERAPNQESDDSLISTHHLATFSPESFNLLNLHFLICKMRTMTAAHSQGWSKTQKESCTYIKTFCKQQDATQLWQTVWWHLIK